MIGKLDLAKAIGGRGRRAGGTGKVVAGAARSARSASAGAAGWSTGSRSRRARRSTPASSTTARPLPPPKRRRSRRRCCIHLAGLDTRIAETEFPWIAALRVAGKKVTYFDYPGVNHAFNNDTSAERYDRAAATLAWDRTLRFFRRNLG